MEPQPESIYPPPDQSALAEESLSSLMKTRRYWLVALVPLACVIVVLLVDLAFPDTGIIASSVAGIIAYFVMNYFYPFATTTRRAFYTCIPALLLLAGGTLYAILTVSDYYVYYILLTCAAFLVIIPGLMFFSWHGARLGLRRGR